MHPLFHHVVLENKYEIQMFYLVPFDNGSYARTSTAAPIEKGTVTQVHFP